MGDGGSGGPALSEKQGSSTKDAEKKESQALRARAKALAVAEERAMPTRLGERPSSGFALADQNENYPLHVSGGPKLAACVDHGALRVMLYDKCPEALERFERGFKYICGDGLDKLMGSHVRAKDPRVPRLDADKADTAAANRIIEADPDSSEGDPSDVFPFVVLGDKPATKDGVHYEKRYRLIVWPAHLNAATRADGYVPDVPVTRVPEAASDAAKFVKPDAPRTNWNPEKFAKVAKEFPSFARNVSSFTDDDVVAIVGDYKAAFNQYEIPEEARKFYRFEDSAGRRWRLRVFPMGHCATPEAVHAVTDGIAQAAVEAVKHLGNVHYRIIRNAYIDNVRFIGSLLAVQAAWKEFKRLSAEVGLIINEEKGNVPHAQGEFCGVAYDYASGLVGLSAKTRAKLAAVGARNEERTVHQWEKDFGMLVWAACVLQIRWAKFFPVMSAHRRISHAVGCGKLARTDRVIVDEETAAAVAALRDHLLNHPPVVPRAPEGGPADVDLFVDASLRGWGAVVAKGGQIFVAAGKWTDNGDPSDDNISVLEARAAHRGASALRQHIEGQHLKVWIDNDAARCGIDAGNAKSEAVAREAETAAELLLEVSASWCVARVPTEMNPADEPSRGDAASLSKTLASLGELRRQDATGMKMPRGWRWTTGK